MKGRTGAIVAVLAVGLGSLIAQPAAWAGWCIGGCGITPNPDGYTYYYADGSIYRASASRSTGTDAQGNPVEVFLVPACNGNNVDENGNSAGNLCNNAVHACPNPEQVLYWRYQRPAGSGTVPQRIGSECVGGDARFSLADLRAAYADYLRRLHLPTPTVTTAPPGGTLVNLPTAVWTQDPGGRTLPVTTPVPAVIAAEPHWTWQFGDGTTGPDEPGTAFTGSPLPVDAPDDYLTHTWRHTGTVTITCTLTWSGTFTIPGIPQAFDLTPVSYVAAVPLVVHEAATTLVADP